MIKGYNVVRLEKALQAWENTCFLPEMILRYGTDEMKKHYNFGLSGPIVNHSKLRMALLKTSDDFQLDDFVGKGGVAEYLAELDCLPLSLFFWTRLSRRVFQFSQDLQTLLSAISLEKITWDMVNLPLPSFVIALSEPLNDGLGWEFDCILIADATEFAKKAKDVEKGKRVLHFALFSTNLDNVKPISPNDKKKMRRAVSRKDYSQFGVFARKYFNAGDVSKPGNVFKTQNMRAGFVEVADGDSVLETFGKQMMNEDATADQYQRYSVVDKALHQMVAFCLYLDSLKPSQRDDAIEKVKQSSKSQSKGTKAIADASEIFLVKCEHYLSDEEKIAIGKIRQIRKTESVCVHWRRGYCRRMPGKGSDPDAPKVVIVRPTLVNAKLLQPDTLPVGSKSILT